MQDTCQIHHDTTGYVSDRKSPPKTIGNPPAPYAGTVSDTASKSDSPECGSDTERLRVTNTESWPRPDRTSELGRVDSLIPYWFISGLFWDE